MRCSAVQWCQAAVTGCQTSRLVQETGLEPLVMPSGAHGSTSDHNATLSLYSWTEVHLVQAAGLRFFVVIRCVVQTLSDYNNPPQADFLQHGSTRGAVGSVVLLWY